MILECGLIYFIFFFSCFVEISYSSDNNDGYAIYYAAVMAHLKIYIR